MGQSGFTSDRILVLWRQCNLRPVRPEHTQSLSSYPGEKPAPLSRVLRGRYPRSYYSSATSVVSCESVCSCYWKPDLSKAIPLDGIHIWQCDAHPICLCQRRTGRVKLAKRSIPRHEWKLDHWHKRSLRRTELLGRLPRSDLVLGSSKKVGRLRSFSL